MSKNVMQDNVQSEVEDREGYPETKDGLTPFEESLGEAWGIVEASLVPTGDSF